MPDSNTPETQAPLPVTAEDRKLWSAAFEAWNAGRNGFNPGGDHEAAAAILARHRVSHSLPRDTRIAVENIVTTMESNSFLIVREFAAHLRTALASLSTPTAEPMGPYASDRDLIEAAVQASLDAGLAENGVHGVAAARHAARFVVESREYWRNIERANLAAEVRQIKEAKQAPAIPADIGMNLAAAFGPILKEAFPEHSAQHRHAACDALAEAVVARAGWFAALTTPPTPARIGKDAVRERVGILEAALWSVLSYDQLLRQYSGPQAILFAGDVANIDATYDAMVAKVTAALSATPAQEGEGND